MADIILKAEQSVPGDTKFTYKDMGDGTHAEQVYVGEAVGPGGDNIDIRQSRVDVAATSTAVIAADDSRKYLILINDSDTVMYVSFGAAATLYSGVRINANGGNYEMSAAFGNNFVGAIYAIHESTGNTKRLLVNEGV